ncbi:Hypothetical predicted protein [Prunus dulcis]|uniref:Uncharacterized protein n=1 Tax=Prunus dulcis TaxID=3755 RepID=A0A5E4F566_PRUDU|nr:hypothetical protein L3X38_031155 [Prunus dulcis]VVA23133.1 Hypothetical predicted protein [Prunus dulcis]
MRLHPINYFPLPRKDRVLLRHRLPKLLLSLSLNTEKFQCSISSPELLRRKIDRSAIDYRPSDYLYRWNSSQSLRTDTRKERIFEASTEE